MGLAALEESVERKVGFQHQGPAAAGHRVPTLPYPAVIAFNRVARALRTILSRVFNLVTANFFDDFCQLELWPLQNSAWSTAEAVMKLLGWRISEGEEKRKHFAKSFKILGAVIIFPTDQEKVVEVTNKTSRLAQLSEMTDQLKAKCGGRMPKSFLESYKGRLLYAAGHTYGPCA